MGRREQRNPPPLVRVRGNREHVDRRRRKRDGGDGREAGTSDPAGQRLAERRLNASLLLLGGAGASSVKVSARA
jgi:predicted metalloprotease